MEDSKYKNGPYICFGVSLKESSNGKYKYMLRFILFIFS